MDAISLDATAAIADRVRTLRVMRGLTQQELAQLAGLSLRTVKTVEHAEAAVRLATLRAIAKVFRVTTERLLGTGGDTRGPDPMVPPPWEDVRAALYRPAPPEGPPSERAVLAGIRAVRPHLAANRYDQARMLLPALLAESAALEGPGGRTARSQVLNMTAWLLTMSRQWEDAATTARLAIDAAQRPGDRIAAANTLCWLLLRQGRLGEASVLAQRWADETEPRRWSRACDGELAGWGKLWLGIANAAVRNNEPGRAADALRIAASAAARIGREVETDASTTRTFGPVSVRLIEGETALLAGQPDRTIEIGKTVPRGELVHAMSASVLRHRLDVAGAYAQRGKWGDAVDVLDGIRRRAPQWLVRQRPARDVMEDLIDQRRSLTPKMRVVAEAVLIDI